MAIAISEIVETYKNRFQVGLPYVVEKPVDDLSLIITIPAFKEPDIEKILQSLAECEKPAGIVEILLVINAPAEATEDVLKINQKAFETARMLELPEFLQLRIIRSENIAKKYFGAGMARKIGMDEAVQRWAALKKDGPIVCLDADCTVSPDYLIKASQAFADHSVNVAHFKFQHDLSLQADDNLRAGIVAYELHLRCYVQGLKKAGYFFAIHTIGSCMAVRSSSYARAGGMNKKTAGEDFYFLHKLIPHGGWKYIDAMVYPSSRISDRVPFGTGRAQLEWLENSTGGFTYNIEVYKVMEALFKATKKWFLNEIILDEFHPILQRFLTKVNARQRISELRRQSTSLETFEKRCRQWMDGFWVLKLTHYLRDNGFPNQPVELVAKSILNINSESREELLNQLRSIDYLEP